MSGDHTDQTRAEWSSLMPTPLGQQPRETFDVFLCHNGADKDWVRKLAEQIESETFDGLPSGRPLRVFFDEWDIDVGQNVLLRINRGLTASRYVAVVISPEILAAPWPSLEWTHVVSDDPTNRKGRIIPLFLSDYSEAIKQHAELPAPFKALNWIDFRRPADFRRSYFKLIRKLRDELPARGRKLRPLASNRREVTPLHAPSEEMAAAPDRVSDILLGNMLPVQDYPKTIWFAPTDARLPEDVRRNISESAQFILREKLLLTFADLTRRDEPLRAVIDEFKISARPVAAWKDDPVRWRWIISLLNCCLRSHFSGLPIKRDDKGRFFFRPTKEGTARVWKNGNDPERTVADRKETPTGEVFWVHHGARLALSLYRDHFNGPPNRVVIHKTSRYWPEELAGFKAALDDVHSYDFLALERRGVRFLRLGKEPPVRGTVIQLAQRNYLIYTQGYIPFLRQYPGPRIPNPLEIVEHHGDSSADRVCSEILALTKLNWNTCKFAGSEPITIAFSRQVGTIIKEMPDGVEPSTKYRFYM